MPFVDDFPHYVREQLDKVYDGDLSHVFDIREAREALQSRREELIAEVNANQRLQLKFDQTLPAHRKTLVASVPLAGRKTNSPLPGAPVNRKLGGGGN